MPHISVWEMPVMEQKKINKKLWVNIVIKLWLIPYCLSHFVLTNFKVSLCGHVAEDGRLDQDALWFSWLQLCPAAMVHCHAVDSVRLCIKGPSVHLTSHVSSYVVDGWFLFSRQPWTTFMFILISPLCAFIYIREYRKRRFWERERERERVYVAVRFHIRQPAVS